MTTSNKEDRFWYIVKVVFLYTMLSEFIRLGVYIAMLNDGRIEHSAVELHEYEGHEYIVFHDPRGLAVTHHPECKCHD